MNKSIGLFFMVVKNGLFNMLTLSHPDSAVTVTHIQQCIRKELV